MYSLSFMLLAFFVVLGIGISPCLAALTEANVISLVEKMTPDGSGKVKAVIRKDQLTISVYQHRAATETDLKIDAVLIAKAILDKDPASFREMKVCFFEKNNTSEYNAVKVEPSQIRLFGEGKISQEALLQLVSVRKETMTKPQPSAHTNTGSHSSASSNTSTGSGSNASNSRKIPRQEVTVSCDENSILYAERYELYKRIKTLYENGAANLLPVFALQEATEETAKQDDLPATQSNLKRLSALVSEWEKRPRLGSHAEQIDRRLVRIHDVLDGMAKTGAKIPPALLMRFKQACQLYKQGRLAECDRVLPLLENSLKINTRI